MPEPITALRPVPLVPEISLHLAAEPVGLYASSAGEFRSDQPPPFWAFVWAGGQALARYVLDHPEVVAGRTVHDLATGSGVVAIAAAMAGAAAVTVSDIDPAAVAAARRNAAANDVTLAMGAPDAEVILAGDACYSPTVTTSVITLLRKARRKPADVLVGDPDRGYLPVRLFEPLAAYVVPVPPVLEETGSLATTVWRMR